MNSHTRGWARPTIHLSLAIFLILAIILSPAAASIGDRLPDFKQCVRVCEQENCVPTSSSPTPIPLLRRLLFWTCPAECDYTCQHIITARRLEAGQKIVQFHGKWPFHRVLGVQEPVSVIFSIGNLYVHWNGLDKIRSSIPAQYPLRKYYALFAQIGVLAWVLSTIFHARDLPITEELDYLGAGLSVLYGMYYTPIRIFRLDLPTKKRESILRLWTVICILAYITHVAYLKFVKWDYGYNMMANVVLGVAQNSLWSWFSYKQYRQSQRPWAALPGIAVAWVMLAMSLELLDFPPLWGFLDAHSLWHAGTIYPAILWYRFLVMDAQDDLAGNERVKS